MPRGQLFKSRAMLVMEDRIGRPLEDFLADRYETATQAQIAAELKVDRSTVNRWMRDLGVEARFPGQRPEAA